MIRGDSDASISGIELGSLDREDAPTSKALIFAMKNVDAIAGNHFIEKDLTYNLMAC